MPNPTDADPTPGATDARAEPRTDRRLAVREDHHCFGCGQQNPIGLRLPFYEEAGGTGRVWAPWTPAREHQGFEGIAHGGLITTVLDEVMGWVLYQRHIWAVTGTITVRFRRPVELGVETRAVAWVVREASRKVDVAAELRRTSDDLLLAEATAVFVRVSEEQATAWQGRYVGDEVA